MENRCQTVWWLINKKNTKRKDDCMITIYRPSNYNNPRAPEFTGRSIDTKYVQGRPVLNINGALVLVAKA